MIRTNVLKIFATQLKDASTNQLTVMTKMHVPLKAVILLLDVSTEPKNVMMENFAPKTAVTQLVDYANLLMTAILATIAEMDIAKKILIVQLGKRQHTSQINVKKQSVILNMEVAKQFQ
jgi:hypothetical protein